MRLLTTKQESMGQAQGWTETGKWAGDEARKVFREACKVTLRVARDEEDESEILVLFKQRADDPSVYLFHEGNEPRLLVYWSRDGSGDEALSRLFDRLLAGMGFEEIGFVASAQPATASHQ